MEQQLYNWTCSICSFTWVCNAIGIPMDRIQAGSIIGYPSCVNETYGLMSADCLINAFASVNLKAIQGWYTFQEAYSICRDHTGVINPLGMYHFMGVRGVSPSTIWVANSAPGYCGITDDLNKYNYDSLGPTQLIWIKEWIG